MLELLLANQHFKREVDRLRTEILRATRANAEVVEGLKKEIAERAEIETLKGAMVADDKRLRDAEGGA
jgi:hypothetical protein